MVYLDHFKPNMVDVTDMGRKGEGCYLKDLLLYSLVICTANMTALFEFSVDLQV